MDKIRKISEKELKEWFKETQKDNVPIMPCGHRWFTKKCAVCKQIEMEMK